MARPIPNQPITYLLLQFKQAKFDKDLERMSLMFDTLLWQHKHARKINKGQKQKLVAKIQKLKQKLSEVQHGKQ